MRVEYVNDKYHVSAPYEALEIMRGAPIRRWHKPSDTWIMPPVSAVRNYLVKHGAVFVDGAEHAPEHRLVRPRYLGAAHTFKTTPFEHQLQAAGAALDRTGFALFMEPGTGKSKVLIDDAATQHRMGRVAGMMVVCPNSIKGNWQDEFNIHCAIPHDAHVWEAGGHKKFDRWMASAPVFPVLIMAVESLSTKSAMEVAEKFLRSAPMVMAVDESSRIKTWDTARTKNVTKLGKLAAYRRVATGTPATQGPHNLWSQFETIDPAILDMDFYPFRNFFCVMGGYKLKQVVAPKNQDILLEMVLPYVYRATKLECLDLPEKIYQRRRVPLSAEQERIYGEIFSGAQDGGAAVALVRDLRLHQLLGGFVASKVAQDRLTDLLQTDPDAALRFLEDEQSFAYVMEPVPGPNPRLDDLVAFAEECPGKIIVWCRYRAEIEVVAQALRPLGGVVEFHGGVDKEGRDAARRDFQTDPAVRFFVGQISTGGIGITLTAASVMAFYSCDWSAENRIQAEDRNHRIGATGDHCLYVDFTADGHYVDTKILNAVRRGIDYHRAVMEELGAHQ